MLDSICNCFQLCSLKLKCNVQVDTNSLDEKEKVSKKAKKKAAKKAAEAASQVLFPAHHLLPSQQDFFI